MNDQGAGFSKLRTECMYRPRMLVCGRNARLIDRSIE